MEKIKPYLCFKYSYCEKRFDSEKEREKHMRTVHPKPPEDPDKYKLPQRKFYRSRISENAEQTETEDDKNKSGPYSLPLSMISMRCDSKGKSLRPKIRDEVWEFWSEPYWKTVVKYYEGINKDRDVLKNWIERYLITKIAIKLAKKIFENTGLKVFPIVSKVRAGYFEKSAGAWSWSMYSVHKSDVEGYDNSMFVVGSQWTMKKLLLKNVKLEKYYSYFWHVSPTNESLKHIKSKYDE